MIHGDVYTSSYNSLTSGAPEPSVAEGKRQRLQEDIANALRENLARGFLEGEERFRQIADAISDIVALTNADISKVYFVNAAYEQIWGRRRDDLLQDPMSYLEGVHPDDRARVRDAILGEPRGCFDVEYRVLRPAGDQRWVWSRGYPVRDESGAIYRIAIVTEDITDRRVVAESRHRLMRGFTHDVKNPLGAADGFLELLELGVSGNLTDAQQEYVGRARRDIRIALALVVQLLEIERAQAGELILTHESVDLGTLASDSVEDYRAAAAARQMALTLRIVRTDNDLIMDTDRSRVRQILVNLISNAVKYTREGGSIIVSALAGESDAADAPRPGRWCVLRVADTGPGIPADKQSLLFREFTRFDPNAAQGSGIGLAISQSLARALGGQITVRSIQGVGSTFSLWLPCTREPLPEVA
jgi:PAS domain S-box-containing protein